MLGQSHFFFEILGGLDILRSVTGALQFSHKHAHAGKSDSLGPVKNYQVWQQSRGMYGHTCGRIRTSSRPLGIRP